MPGTGPRARRQRHVPRLHLVAERLQHLRRGADEDGAALGDHPREICLLAEKAVAGVHGVGAGGHQGRAQLVDVQVRLTRGRGAQEHGLVGLRDVRGLGVGFGVDRHRPYPHALAGTDDTAGDLSTIGDQNLRERGRLRVQGLRLHGGNLRLFVYCR